MEIMKSNLLSLQNQLFDDEPTIVKTYRAIRHDVVRQKQKINNNYLEKGNFDLLSGALNENNNTFIIYNNTDDFFV